MGIKAWITVNGNHIPIMDGESKMKAIGRFIKDKIKNKSILTGEMNKQKIKGVKTNSVNSFTYKDKDGKDVKVEEVKGRNGEKGVAITRDGRKEVYKTNKSLEEIRQNAMKNDTAEKINSLSSKYKVKEDKSITTPSGKYTAKELEKRDAGIKNMYKDAWDGKKSYKELNDDLEKMVKEGKVSRGELSSLQYEASREHDNAKASNKQDKKTLKLKDTEPEYVKQIKENQKKGYTDAENYAKELNKAGDNRRESWDKYYQMHRDYEAKNKKLKEKYENPDDKYVPSNDYDGFIAKRDYLDENRKGTGLRWTGKEYTNDQFLEHLEDANWHSERRMLVDAKLTNRQLSYIKDKTKLDMYSVDLDRAKTEKLIKEAKAKYPSEKKYTEKTATDTNSATHYKRVNGVRGFMGTTYALYDKNNNLVKIVGTKKEAESLTKSPKSNTGVLRTKIVENAYKKYMKEHPNSKMKLSDFKSEYKKKNK